MNRILTLFMLLFTLPLQAGIVSKSITYKHGDTELTGILFYDESIKETRPGVMVVHEWWGLNDYAKERARQLAEMGYVAFAADMYGGKKVTTHGKNAKEWMSQITANVDVWQERAMLGLEQLKSHPGVDANKLAAIGYCFGGATVMQMAYTGTDELKGVVSFHGSLPPAPESAEGKIKSKILAAHGAADPFVPAEKVTTFQQSLNEAGADWEMDIYSNTRHGFTNKGASEYGMEALQYSAVADQRSWNSMQNFFKEIFQ